MLELLPTNRALSDYEVEQTFPGIGHKTMLLNAYCMDHEPLILLAIEDITARKRALLENQRLLLQTPALGCALQLDDVTYYVGHETIVHAEDGSGLWRWEEQLYAAMARNALHVSDFLRLPSDGVVEIGRQISI